MTYQSRKKYTSRREKYEKTKRATRLVLIFATLVAIVILIKNRYEIATWFNTFFK